MILNNYMVAFVFVFVGSYLLAADEFLDSNKINLRSNELPPALLPIVNESQPLRTSQVNLRAFHVSTLKDCLSFVPTTIVETQDGRCFLVINKQDTINVTLDSSIFIGIKSSKMIRLKNILLTKDEFSWRQVKGSSLSAVELDVVALRAYPVINASILKSSQVENCNDCRDKYEHFAVVIPNQLIYQHRFERICFFQMDENKDSKLRFDGITREFVGAPVYAMEGQTAYWVGLIADKEGRVLDRCDVSDILTTEE